MVGCPARVRAQASSATTGESMLPPSAGCGAAMTQGGSRVPRWQSASSSPTTTLRSRYWPERTISVAFAEDEELQIPSFGKREQGGMVGRLPLLLQHFHLPVGLRRRLPDRAGELIGRDARRAGSGGEDAARGERFQRDAVERRIAIERGSARIAAAPAGSRADRGSNRSSDRRGRPPRSAFRARAR